MLDHGCRPSIPLASIATWLERRLTRRQASARATSAHALSTEHTGAARERGERDNRQCSALVARASRAPRGVERRHGLDGAGARRAAPALLVARARGRR